ncbi:LEA type 2 family protein [Candidatus Halobeggiatoa sp. HSG11]|nr:LEA type 2 family protein [Candidatus Halobeggiatoa sp. HSG11]
MYKLFKFSTSLIIIGILTACGNMPLKTFTPEVSLQGFKLMNLGLLKQDYRLKLQLKNPNPVPIPINGLNYKLELNGQEFTNGSSDKSVTIPANGEEFLEIDVTSNLLSTIGQFKDLKSLLNRNFEYNLSGDINVIDGTTAIPFTYKGDISLLRN